LIRIPILLYHRVDQEAVKKRRPFCVHPDDFKQQMEWLKQQGFQTISLNAFHRYYTQGEPVPAKPIIVTFDDGFYCNYSRVYPIMKELDYTATIFLATDLMRSEGEKGFEAYDGFMNWNEIRKMQCDGFSFEAHGCSHQALPTLSLEKAEHEIRESRKIIKKMLNTEVDFYCYPYGQANGEIHRIVEKCGYKGACGPTFYGEDGPHNWYSIGRAEILWGDSLNTFKFKVEHGLSRYYYAKQQMGKVKRMVTGLKRTG